MSPPDHRNLHALSLSVNGEFFQGKSLSIAISIFKIAREDYLSGGIIQIWVSNGHLNWQKFTLEESSPVVYWGRLKYIGAKTRRWAVEIDPAARPKSARFRWMLIYVRYMAQTMKPGRQRVNEAQANSIILNLDGLFISLSDYRVQLTGRGALMWKGAESSFSNFEH